MRRNISYNKINNISLNMGATRKQECFKSREEAIFGLIEKLDNKNRRKRCILLSSIGAICHNGKYIRMFLLT